MLKKIVLSIFIFFLLAFGVFAQTAQTITLKPGFNFIGFTASISSTPAQLKTQNPVIEDIYLFSAAAGSFLSAAEGTLSTLTAGKGYIIKSSAVSDTVINIPGDAVQTIGNINLKTGFNLIGFSKIPSTTLSFSSLMNVYSAIKGIYKWSPAAGSFIQVVRDNSGTVTLLDGADPSFKSGDSYFFNMAEDTTINYDGSTIILGNGPPAPIEKTLELTGIVGASPAAASPSYSLARAIDLSAMQVSVYDEINNLDVEGATITTTGTNTFKATLPVATADRYLSVLVKNAENKIIYKSFLGRIPKATEVTENTVKISNIKVSDESTARAIIVLENRSKIPITAVIAKKSVDTSINNTDFALALEERIAGLEDRVPELKQAVNLIANVLTTPGVDNAIKEKVTEFTFSESSKLLSSYVSLLQNADTLQTVNNISVPAQLYIGSKQITAQSTQTDIYETVTGINDTIGQRVEMPVLDPPPGQYNSAIAVKMTCATPNANIIYDYGDGRQGINYTGPVAINKTCKLNVAAFRSDWPMNWHSKFVNATYTIGSGGGETTEIKTLAYISLDKTSEIIAVTTEKYDLSSIKITAHYSNGDSIEVQTARWEMISSPGAFSYASNYYFLSGKTGEAIFNAIYAENGIEKKIEFKLIIKTLEEIDKLNKTIEITGRLSMSLNSSNINNSTNNLHIKLFDEINNSEINETVALFIDPGNFKITFPASESLKFASIIITTSDGKPIYKRLLGKIPAVSEIAGNIQIKNIIVDDYSTARAIIFNEDKTKIPLTIISKISLDASSQQTDFDRSCNETISGISENAYEIQKTIDFFADIVINPNVSQNVKDKVKQTTLSCVKEVLSDYVSIIQNSYEIDKLIDFPSSITLAGKLVNSSTSLTEINEITAKIIQAISLIVSTPIFEPVSETFFSDTMEIKISCATPGAIIRYTINNFEFDANSLVYQGPITINSSSGLMAIAYKDGMTKSYTARANYINRHDDMYFEKLLLSKDSDCIIIGETYDFSKIKAYGYYSDGSTKEVPVTWSAGLELKNNIYYSQTASDSSNFTSYPSAQIKARYNSPNLSGDEGRVSAFFTLEVKPDTNMPSTITSVDNKITKVITNAGGVLNTMEFSDNSGISLEIPINAIKDTAEVTLAEVFEPSIGEFYEPAKGNNYGAHQGTLFIRSNVDISGATLKIPLPSDFPDDISQDCVHIVKVNTSTKEIVKIPFRIEKTLSAPSANRFMGKMSIQISVAIAVMGYLAYEGVNEYKNRWRIHHESCKPLLLNNDQFLKEPYEIPFYQQYYGTCASASLLMANTRYGSITNILKSYSTFVGENKGIATVQFCENSTLQFTKFNYIRKCFTEIASHIITQLGKGPVLLIFRGPNGSHAIVITGYKGYSTTVNNNGKVVGDYSGLIFIAHDPLVGPYVEYSFNSFKDYLKEGDMYTNPYSYEAASKISIHMPDYTTGSDLYHIGNASGIAFQKDGTVIDYIWWDHLSSDGYKLFNSTHNTYEENPININSFDTIEFKGIPVYNTEKTNTQYSPSLKLRTRILRNGNEVYTNDSAELVKSGYSYPITNYNINWKNLRESSGTIWAIGDVFSVYVHLVESTGEGNLKTEIARGNFNFSFTSK